MVLVSLLALSDFVLALEFLICVTDTEKVKWCTPIINDVFLYAPLFFQHCSVNPVIVKQFEQRLQTIST
jgi:hypothetical protein